LKLRRRRAQRPSRQGCAPRRASAAARARAPGAGAGAVRAGDAAQLVDIHAVRAGLEALHVEADFDEFAATLVHLLAHRDGAADALIAFGGRQLRHRRARGRLEAAGGGARSERALCGRQRGCGERGGERAAPAQCGGVRGGGGARGRHGAARVPARARAVSRVAQRTQRTLAPAHAAPRLAGRFAGAACGAPRSATRADSAIASGG
jgi:hypothetical protein